MAKIDPENIKKLFNTPCPAWDGSDSDVALSFHNAVGAGLLTLQWRRREPNHLMPEYRQKWQDMRGLFSRAGRFDCALDPRSMNFSPTVEEARYILSHLAKIFNPDDKVGFSYYQSVVRMADAFGINLEV